MIMKRKILLAALLGAAASLSLAETKTVHGKYTNNTGSRMDITGVSETTELILDSTQDQAANQGEMFRISGKTVKSITAIDSNASDNKGAVNIASNNEINGVLVDIKSSIDATAISAASWKQNFMTLVIGNSVEDYKKANITVDFGSNLTLTGANADQKQTISFEHFYGTVKAKNAYLSNSGATNTSTLSISEDSSVIWDGGRLETGNDKKSRIQIDGKLTFKANSNTTFVVKKGGEFVIGQNGTFSSTNNTLSIDYGSTADIYGSLEMGGGSTLWLNGKTNIYNTTPTKQLSFYKLNSAGEFNQATATSNNGVRFKRAAEINTGAKWTVDGIVDIYGERISTADLSVTRAVLNVNSGANFIVKREATNARIRLWGNSELNIWQENAFKDENGGSIRLATATDIYSEYGSLVNLYATQTFKDLYVTSGSNLEIYLHDLAQLILDGEEQTLWNNTADGLKIYNFRENAIYVGTNAANAFGIANAKFFDADGNLISNVRIGENGWLTAAIPEPAEWAAIFGAIALALAVYRRRK